MAQERLQKIIAHAGLCSRRQAEKLIQEGVVKVNGVVVTALGSKADPTRDRIMVHGKKLIKDARRYVLFHKPTQCVTTNSDDRGRPTVFDYIKGIEERLFSVGRLDFDTEGLLLLTNDGELASALTHPIGEIPKTYQVKVVGIPSLSTLEALQTGVLLEDGPAQVNDVFMIHPGKQVSKRNTWLEMTVTEGRNRLIRRLLEQVGHPVLRLRRIRFAHLELNARLKAGQWKDLKADEIRKLKNLAKQSQQKRQKFKAQQQADDDWGFGF